MDHSLPTTPVQPSSLTPSGKEHQPVSGEQQMVEHVPLETTVSAEVKEVGVAVVPEAVEIPPDLAQIGVKAGGHHQPVVQQTTSSTPVLPISDDQVVAGLHATITSSLRWLAECCLKQLKKAHLALKFVQGKVVRIQY